MADIMFEEALQLARQEAENIKSGRMPKITATQFSNTATLPFTVASYQVVLLYRAAELAETACDLFAGSKLVSALTLTRSLMEATTKLFVLHLQVSQVVEKECVGVERKNVLQDLLGTRLPVILEGNPNLQKARNILTDLEKITKVFPDFTRRYDWLSDYAHPNVMGVLLTYGTLHPETNTLHLSPGMDEQKARLGLLYLLEAERTFIDYFNKLTLLQPKFNAICEEDVDIITPL